MQVTFVPSVFVPVIETVSPSTAPESDIEGVASEVRLSEFDDPVSDAGNRSGAAEAAGGLESMVIGNAGPAADSLPAGSVTFADTDQSPSDIVGGSQLFTVDEATYVHETDDPSGFVPLIVTVLPSGTAPPDRARVLSFVKLSEFEDPLSDAGRRSGAGGTAGATVSTMSDNDADAGEVLPARSVWVADTSHVPSVSVPKSQDAAGNT